MGTRGPVAYSGYMGARGRGYMGEGVQLLTVGTCGQEVQLLTVDSWGRDSSCLQRVRDGRTYGAGVQLFTVGTWEGGGGPAAYSGYMGGPAAYRGYMWAGDPAAHSGYMRAGGSGGSMG